MGDVIELKIYICDYIDYTDNSVRSFIVEAESMDEAEEITIKEPKALHIPKRYLIKLEEVL